MRYLKVYLSNNYSDHELNYHNVLYEIIVTYKLVQSEITTMLTYYY